MKKATLIVLVLLFLFTVVGCTEQTKNEITEKPSTNTPQNTPTNAITSTPTHTSATSTNKEEGLTTGTPVATTPKPTTPKPTTPTPATHNPTTSIPTTNKPSSTPKATPGSTNAGNEVASEGLAYVEVTGGYAVSGIGNCKDTKIVIPSKYNGKSVVQIARNAFSGNKNIISVQLPESITIIKGSAFKGATNLKTINFPSTLRTIEIRAFEGCPLESFAFPVNLKSIDDYAFTNIKMKELTLPNNIKVGDFVFSGSAVEKVTLPKNFTFENAVFLGCESLKTVVLAEGVSEIPFQCFRDCTALETINWPGSLCSVQGYAFYGCTSLKLGDVMISGTLQNFGFYGVKMETLTVRLEEIPIDAFTGITAKKVVLMEGLTKMGDSAFEKSSIKEISLPASLTGYYGGNALFKDVTELEEMVFKSPVKLGYMSLYHCPDLKTVTLPAGSSFSDNTFEKCTALETIYYGGTVAEWKELTVPDELFDEYNFDELNGVRIICSDGEI